MKGILKVNKKYLILFFVIICITFLSGCSGVTPSGPTISSFTASSTTTTEGDSVTLSWVTDTTSVSIDQGVGPVTAPSGSTTVTPVSTTTYTLTAINSAGSTTATLTITVGTGMDEAIKVMVEEILPEIPEIQSGDPYVCLKLDSLLPPGTVIEEDAPTASKSSVKITLEEELYFFYLDLAPGALYEHPVKYILVDDDGNHGDYVANWWPKINNEIPEIIAKDFPDEEDIIASNVTLKKTAGIVQAYQPFLIPSQWREGFIVVQGLLPYEKVFNGCNDTYLNAVNFFNAYKNSFSRVEGLVQSQATQVLDTIDTMAEEDRGIITLFIIAHGGTNSIRLGGYLFYASQFRNKMAEHPDIVFNFILGSCHSGSFIDELSSLDNVCVVETACSADESAYGDVDEWYGSYDYNPSDVGTGWTSSLIQAMVSITQDSSKMNSIQTWASNDEVPVTCMLIYQAGYGALGYQAALGLTHNLDFENVLGWSTPNHYYCREMIY